MCSAVAATAAEADTFGAARFGLILKTAFVFTVYM